MVEKFVWFTIPRDMGNSSREDKSVAALLRMVQKIDVRSWTEKSRTYKSYSEGYKHEVRERQAFDVNKRLANESRKAFANPNTRLGVVVAGTEKRLWFW